MNVQDNAVVSFDYKLTDDDGVLIDSSEGGEPLEYMHGAGTLIPGLEKELLGKTTGDALTVRVAPEDGYGERDEELVQPVSRDQLPKDEEIVIGSQLVAESDEGTVIMTVTSIEGDQVFLDPNHPLAGVALNFDVTVREIREATAEEIEHGHVHGESCEHDHGGDA